MDPQTIFLPAKPRVHRKRRAASASAAPVGPLTLVSAGYVAEGPYVDLTFDRAVDAGGADASAFVVLDGVTLDQRLEGVEATLTAPATVRVTLEAVEHSGTPGVTMTAGAPNGVVASDDPTDAWAGVTDLELPFPS